MGGRAGGRAGEVQGHHRGAGADLCRDVRLLNNNTMPPSYNKLYIFFSITKLQILWESEPRPRVCLFHFFRTLLPSFVKCEKTPRGSDDERSLKLSWRIFNAFLDLSLLY